METKKRCPFIMENGKGEYNCVFYKNFDFMCPLLRMEDENGNCIDVECLELEPELYAKIYEYYKIKSLS